MSDHRVAMSAACKTASTDGEAWATWRGERLRLRRFVPAVDEFYPNGLDVVYVVSGHFRTGVVVEKDGLRHYNGKHYKYKLQEKQIRAVVVERHARGG